jgi:hypothetical protein
MIIPPLQGRAESHAHRVRPGRGSSHAEPRDDRFNDSIEIGVHLRIPETQNLESECTKFSVARPIARHMPVETVLTAVDFDHDTVLEARKVDNEMSNRHLSAKVQSGRSQGTKLHPKLHLLRRHALAQGSRHRTRYRRGKPALLVACVGPAPRRFAPSALP